MSTLDHFNDFSAFASRRLSATQELTIDELYEEWRSKAFAENDALAVMASVRDLVAGERGQPLQEFLAEFDAGEAGAP